MLVFTPGPTEIPPRVLRAMARPITNPDLDPEFADFYEATQRKLMRLMRTKNDVLIMSAEGLLGLESAIASLVRKGDKVVTVTNGVYGDGFCDFVKMYGGTPVRVEERFDTAVDPGAVEEALDANKDARLVTFVHCETPSAVINPLKEVARACRKRDVLLVVDAVSSLGGAPVDVDSWGVDVCLGASQKCISAPPGLAFMSVSKRAWEDVSAKKDTVGTYYMSLWQWNEWWKKKRLFPYTPSISDFYALDEGLDMLLEEGLGVAVERHRKVSSALISACRAIGLAPFPRDDSYHSPTVTAFRTPRGISDIALTSRMQKRYSVMIAGSWGKLSGKVLRLGNMGFNAQPKKALMAIGALQGALEDLGFEAKASGLEAAKAILGTPKRL